MATAITAEQQLIAAYRQMYRFMVAANARGLKGLLTDDFVLVHITGYTQPRDEWLAHIDSGRMRYFAEDEDAIYLRGELPDVAVDEAELDRVLGTLYAAVEANFRPLLRLAFASRFAR